MEQIVDERMRVHASRPIVCELSGGLDSSYVASLIGRRTPGTSAYMWSFPEYQSHGLSEECAREVAGRHQLDLRVVSPEMLCSRSLDEPLPYSDEPAPFFWQGIVFGPTMARLVPRGSVIFTGMGSDQLFLAVPALFSWLLGQGRFSDLLPLAKDYSRVRSRSSAHILLQSALALLPERYAMPLLAGAHQRQLPFLTTEDVDPQLSFVLPSWLRPKGSRRRASDLLAEERASHAAYFANGIHKFKAPFAQIMGTSLGFGPFLNAHGCSYEHPYCDERLIDFVHRKVSWHLIHEWKRPYKSFLRDMQRGVVPEMVRQRPRNDFNFSGFHAKFLRRNEETLRDLLLGGMPDELTDSVVEKGVLDGFERLLYGDLSVDAQKVSVLLMYLLWYRDFNRSCS
jgi:hypothetical protein